MKKIIFVTLLVAGAWGAYQLGAPEKKVVTARRDALPKTPACITSESVSTVAKPAAAKVSSAVLGSMPPVNWQAPERDADPQAVAKRDAEESELREYQNPENIPDQLR
jgi:hypothetical protein